MHCTEQEAFKLCSALFGINKSIFLTTGYEIPQNPSSEEWERVSAKYVRKRFLSVGVWHVEERTCIYRAHFHSVGTKEEARPVEVFPICRWKQTNFSFYTLSDERFVTASWQVDERISQVTVRLLLAGLPGFCGLIKHRNAFLPPGEMWYLLNRDLEFTLQNGDKHMEVACRHWY